LRAGVLGHEDQLVIAVEREVRRAVDDELAVRGAGVELIRDRREAVAVDAKQPQPGRVHHRQTGKLRNRHHDRVVDALQLARDRCVGDGEEDRREEEQRQCDPRRAETTPAPHTFDYTAEGP